MNAIEQRIHNLVEEMRGSPLFTDQRKEDLSEWSTFYHRNYQEQARDVCTFALGYLYHQVLDDAAARHPPDEGFTPFICTIQEVLQATLPEGREVETFLEECEVFREEEEQVQTLVDDHMERLIFESNARTEGLEEEYERLKATGEGLERRKLLQGADKLARQAAKMTKLFTHNAEKMASFAATLKKFEDTVHQITEELKRME